MGRGIGHPPPPSKKTKGGNMPVTTEKAGKPLEVFEAGPAPAAADSQKRVEKTAVVRKKVRYHSRRAQFGCCIQPGRVERDPVTGRVSGSVPARHIVFDRHTYETDDPVEIAWLDAYINDPKRSKDEVFRAPEVDELIVPNEDGTGLLQRLEGMTLDELRDACRVRSIEVRPIDDETALRYKLLKKLSGLGGKQDK